MPLLGAKRNIHRHDGKRINDGNYAKYAGFAGILLKERGKLLYRKILKPKPKGVRGVGIPAFFVMG